MTISQMWWVSLAAVGLILASVAAAIALGGDAKNSTPAIAIAVAGLAFLKASELIKK